MSVQSNSSSVLIPAAQYVRMSTEHQQYSTANQEDVIREYATSRGFQIVETYADAGKSGLNVAGRHQLQRLIKDVQEKNTKYRAILVYDVSRWGRFQDADESAHYEFVCRKSGIEIHYCAEQFENDGGPTSTIIKSVKRAMAGEYSRELSKKVFHAQCRLIELGYRQGGSAGFGLRRIRLNMQGEVKGELGIGERKSLQTDRVILAPGPDSEVDLVNWMYSQFCRHNKRESEIAEELNERGMLTDLGRRWTRGTVHQILTNEKYIGNNVYNRTSFKLKKKHVVNTPEMWVRAEAAFKPIVSPELFYTARGIISERNRRYSDEELLAKLKQLSERNHCLSAHLIDSIDAMPGSGTYRARFGSLYQAYLLAGFEPDRDFSYIEINRHLRHMHTTLLTNLTDKLSAVGASVRLDPMSGLIFINELYSATLILSRCRQTRSGSLRWLMNFQRRVMPDITILVRMDTENAKPGDYYLLPIMDIADPKLILCETNGVNLDTYQFDNLDFFTEISSQRKIELAA